MIYLVTNRKLIRNDTIYNIIEKSVEAGIDAVILREKDLNYDELYAMSVKIKNITSMKNIPLIINNNPQVAKDINSYGLQLSFENFKNKNFDFHGIIGVSVHSLEEAILAEKLGANYIIAGHIFNTSCKPGLKPKGLSFIKNIRKKVQIPLIAIGGINKFNIESVYASGSHGVAIMSTIMKSTNIFKTINELKTKNSLDKI